LSKVTYNGWQISEGTNSVGIVRWIWAFAYVLLGDALFTDFKNLNNIK
jgi:hypothetical protein